MYERCFRMLRQKNDTANVAPRANETSFTSAAAMWLFHRKPTKAGTKSRKPKYWRNTTCDIRHVLTERWVHLPRKV